MWQDCGALHSTLFSSCVWPGKHLKITLERTCSSSPVCSLRFSANHFFFREKQKGWLQVTSQSLQKEEEPIQLNYTDEWNQTLSTLGLSLPSYACASTPQQQGR